MKGSPTILVAEDDPNDVFFLRRAFQRAHVQCQIVDVPNGEEAVKYLQGAAPYNNRSAYPLPNLLLLDLKMPVMSGIEVLEWLKARPAFSEIPALVLSSSDHEDDITRSRILGAKGYHVKPSELNQLTQLARELADHWFSSGGVKEPAKDVL
ncbi:MAG TPA: response regulator [Verrucomicrobiae bacterium]|nr:response regulator [Verrucomicrobiae bacterium]